MNGYDRPDRQELVWELEAALYCLQNMTTEDFQRGGDAAVRRSLASMLKREQRAGGTLVMNLDLDAA